MWLCDLQILQSYILFDHYLMAAKNIEKKKKKHHQEWKVVSDPYIHMNLYIKFALLSFSR